MPILMPKIYEWFKHKLPPMSQTEKDAIGAGDTWHEADLFQGRPQWDKLLAYPKPSLSEEEQAFLDNQVNALISMIDDWRITQDQYDLDEKTWNYLRTSGFFGLHIPKKFGGLEFSALASSTIVQKIATKSATAAVTVMVPNSLGPAELLLKYGTPQQQQQYLHALAKGAEIPCFGLTGPEAGSDAAAMPDVGIVCRSDYLDQKNVLGLKLTFSKRYITLAPVATLIGLAVKVKDPHSLLGGAEDLGITVVLLPRSTPGVEIGARHFPLNQVFMNGPIRGKDVFIPLDFIIGGKEKIGSGWQMLMECLAAGRGISLPALSAATGKHCYRTVGAYAKVRQQFNLSIGKFEAVAEVMGRIAGHTYMLEATRLLTLGAIDQKFKPSVVTAISKYHMTEMARKVINDAMDIHGGRGIILGPRNYLARTYESIPVSITVEGANILTRSLIIFGQGAIRCHPYVLKEIEAVNNTGYLKGLTDFSRAFKAHIWYAVSNMTKLKWHSLTGMYFCSVPQNSKYKKYYKQLSFFSLALSCSAELAMVMLGGNLKRKENLSARLGDVMSYLYMASAVLKYNHDNGELEDDQNLLQWSLEYCLHEIQQAFLYFYLNFPYRFIGRPMLWLIYPPWRNYRLPADDLNLKLSQEMMQPSRLRERLTSHSVAVEKLENTWLKMIALEPLLTKIANKSLTSNERIKVALEKNVITAAEAKELYEFEAMRLDIIQVDEFTSAQLKGQKA